MNQTVIGTFDNTTDADDAVRDLVDAGIPRSAVQVHSQETGTTPPDEGTTHVSGDHDHAHPGFFERIERFFSNLVGDNDRPAEFSHYHEAIRRGGALVSVDLRDDDDFDKVKRVLDDAGAVDIDERAAQWQSSGYTPYRVGGTDESTVSTTGGHLGEGTQGASQDMAGGRTMAAGQTLSSTETSTGGRTMGSMGAMSATAGMGTTAGTTSDTTGGTSSNVTGDTAGVTGTTTSGTPETNLDPMLERDAPSTLQPGTGSSLGLGADMGSTSGIGATAGMGSSSGMGTVSTTGASSPAGLTSGARSASDDTGTGISSGMGMGTGSGLGSGSGVGASTGLATDGDLTSAGSGSTTASGMPTTAGGTGTNREIASTVDTGTGMGTTGLGTDMGPLDTDLDDDLDSDRRPGSGSASAFGSTGSTRTTDEQALPVIEEELAVGKRKVQTGAYRVYTRTTTTPVTEDVTLREEHASIERRPADRPATDADRKEAFVEVKETDETPVIQKTARVVEEVVVGKESSQRTETIHDTLRGTEVEVERVDGDDKNDSTLKPSRP